jgi:hypothetical protein
MLRHGGSFVVPCVTQYFNGIKSNREVATVAAFAVCACVARVVTVISSVALYRQFGRASICRATGTVRMNSLA